MRKIILTYILIIIATIGYSQHSQLLSQYYFNTETFNPGYTGYYNVLNAAIGYRNQWVSMPGSPQSSWLSVQSPIKNKKIAIGGMLYSDKIGITSHTGIYGTYAYRIDIDKNILSLGLSIGYDLTEHKYSVVETVTTNDPNFNSGNEKIGKANFGFGAYYKCEHLFVGLSVPYFVHRDKSEITNPQVSPVNNIHLLVGKELNISKFVIAHPSLLYRTNISSSNQLDINLLLQFYDFLWSGISYRGKDALILILRYDITANFSLGFAHDFGTSKLASYHDGSNEIYLRYRPRYKSSATSPKYF